MYADGINNMFLSFHSLFLGIDGSNVLREIPSGWANHLSLCLIPSTNSLLLL